MTTNIIKLVSADWTTHGGTRWKIGTTTQIPESRRGTQLCSGEVLHAYRSVEQALLMDPAHGCFGEGARILRAITPEIVADDGTKIGCHEITLAEEIDRPAWWSYEAIRRKVQVQFATLCARAVLSVYEDRYPNDDRPRTAIEAAEAYLADDGTTGSRDDDAARAAYAAAYDAAAAARAAARAAAAYAADAADAARAAAAAGTAADAAATAADVAAGTVDVVPLAARAVELVTNKA